MTKKNSNIAVKENVKNEVTKPVENTYDTTRRVLKEAKASCDPVTIIQELDKAINAYHDAPEAEKEKKLQIVNEKYSPATYIFALDNHYAATDTVKKDYKPMVIEVANRFISEYGCKTASEKALADLAASSYARYMQYASYFQNLMHIDYLSNEKNSFYSIFSKEADKAHRQFMMAITTLKQLKSPAPHINVKTNTAFVAQNQQINAVKEAQPEVKGL